MTEPCCEHGPNGHTEQEHHDASACYDQACRFDHPSGGPYPHPCDEESRCRNCRGYVDSMGCDTAITRFRDLDGTVQEWTWCGEECLEAWCAGIRAAAKENRT